MPPMCLCVCLSFSACVSVSVSFSLSPHSLCVPLHAHMHNKDSAKRITLHRTVYLPFIAKNYYSALSFNSTKVETR